MSIRRNLILSLIDAFLASLMVGAGESYLPAFALSVGISQTATGILSTLPLLTGALLQLLSPLAMKKLKSYKSWVLLSICFQALAYLPLLYFSILGESNFMALFLITSLYWGAGFSIGPAWNVWMSHLVPSQTTEKFFAMRLWISQIGILIGIVGGGVLLQTKWHPDFIPSVFTLLFIVAFLCRIGSAVLIAFHDHLQDWFVHQPFEFFSLSKIQTFLSKQSAYKSFFIFMGLFIFVTNISAPFVTPNILAQMKLSYFEYMSTFAALFAGKILFFYTGKRWVEKYGTIPVFFIGALIAAPLPGLWPFMSNVFEAMIVQFVSGFGWGGFEMGLALIFFQDIPKSRKVAVLTIFNLANSVAVVLGSLFGGWILKSYNETADGYSYVFWLGSSLRVIVLLVAWRVLVNKKVLDRNRLISEKMEIPLGMAGGK